MRYIKMMSQIKVVFAPLVSCLVLVVLLIALSAPSRAQGQFYLLAKQAPLESLTYGNSPSMVYLRWDIIEGDLPSDIVMFRLYRNNILIGEFSATQTLSVSDIGKLYKGEYQQRRLLERLSSMKEEALRDEEIADFSTSQYAQAIHARLNSGDTFFSQLVSRQDFNIAVANNRGAYDNPGSGVFRYELKAMNAQNTEVRVGFAEVDTTETSMILPNQNLAQIAQSQCDEPDFRDHYTVALNWDGPATGSEADELAHRLFVSGYDLYRSVDNIASSVLTPPTRNLSLEASSASYDAYGNVKFSGLERVNDVLILTHPDGTLTPEWLETQEELGLAGLQPGDTRAYYLVSRDYTGQFGPTSATLVTVPDMARPPAPWGVEAWLSEKNQRVELSFPTINASSYLDDFSTGKTVCASTNNSTSDGLDTAFLEFVPEGESCDVHPKFRVNTNVQSYLVYRFTNSDDANNFSDSDGDGYSNAAEHPLNRQCSAAPNTGAALIAKMVPTKDQLAQDRLTYIDNVPANNAGEVYWYRLAAVSEGGRFSLLGEPVRVNFPDRALPPKPVVSLLSPSPAICGCEAVYSEDSTHFALAIDAPFQAISLNVGCSANLRQFRADDFLNAKSNACPQYTSSCAGQTPIVSLNMVDPNNPNETLRCEIDAPPGNEFCESGITRIKPTYCDAPTPTFGGFVSSPLTIIIKEPEANTCVSLFQRLDGNYSRVGSTCGETTDTLEYEKVEGEFCGYAVTQDANNNFSAISNVPCTQVAKVEASQPLPPRLDAFLLGDEEATVRWRAPIQPQIVNEVEIIRTSPSGFAPTRVAYTPNTNGGDEQISVTIPPRTATLEQWCTRVRAMSASVDSASPLASKWSAPICVTRSSITPPQWLPWPDASPVPQGDDLVVLNNKTAAAETFSPLSDGMHIPLVSTTLPSACELITNLVGNNAQADIVGRTWLHVSCPRSELAKTRAELSGVLNFIVYRQARKPDGTVSPLMQSSPLIDIAHFSTFTRTGKDDPIPWLYLNDPFIWAYTDFSYTPNLPTQSTFAYVDRSGLVDGWDYRYQIVFFGENQSLKSWRMSPWTQFISPVNSVQSLFQLESEL